MSAASDYHFDWVEYSVVAFMLLTSILIGVYYTFFKKQDSFNEYMLGNRSLKAFPVAMSIVGSILSGIAVLGIPTDIYLYGSQYMVADLATVTVMALTWIFYLPIYSKLKLNSAFEYLELRFDHNVRIVTTLLYSVSLVIFLPAVIFVPAVAFNQVSGVSIYIIAPILSAACLFYTAFGGLKAVVWTDALQNLFTLLALLFVVVLGFIRLGGVQEVFRINKQGNRLEYLNMNPNPFERQSFWTVYLGCIFLYLTNVAVNPGTVQRYLAVPTLRTARMGLLMTSLGFYALCNLCYSLGFILYARYHKCDPVAAGIIKNYNQMVPLYVMEISKDYPGLAGLFMSGVVSAALSTMSSWLNVSGGTLYKDVMEVCFPNVQHSEAKQSKIIKTIVVVLGLISVSLVFVVEKLGTILQIGFSLKGIVYGPFLCLSTLGMFFPRANTKGALSGIATSLLVSGWVVVHAQYYIIQGKIKFPGKITSVEECPSTAMQSFNSSSSVVFTYQGVGSPVVADSSVSLIYQLSYHYYIVIGAISGIVVGAVVSLLTAPPDYSKISPDVFSPYVHRFLPTNMRKARTDKEQYLLNGLIESNNKTDEKEKTETSVL